ncbi:DHS-like NAD/FAD-binding domain-containing protein [Xylariales sp. PMI_506]|nr:DHS-like NAD/FAD-binding domain-containing protein [Xylariales sp. PMI_506]
MDSSSDLSEPPSSDPPSSPLSELSKSPSLSPRYRYPSPLSTAPSGSASPLKMAEPVEADSICVNPDGAPPPKRRKIERKPRTTEHLDLRSPYEYNEEDEELLNRLTSVLRKKKKIVVVAGAGISVSAGIPDFRSSNGLFKTLRTQHKLKASGKQLFDASVYKNRDSTESFHDMVRELAQQTKTAQPTPFHHMIASIAQEGRLLRLYTQNVDGIDTAMPPLATAVPLNTKAPWPKTIQLHGGLEKMVCSKCTEISTFDGSLFTGPEPPLCKGCVETDNVRTSHAGKRSHGIGKLRPRMVLYNEYNPDEEAIANVVKADVRARPDAIVVVGTSMKIPGVRNIVKDMCKVIRDRKDGITAWINIDPEPSGVELKNCWDIVVRGKCDDVASLVGLPHWDDSPALGDDVKVNDADFEQVKETLRATELEVRIPKSPDVSGDPIKEEAGDIIPTGAKPKAVSKVRGIPTPTASPKMRTALPDRPQQKTKQSRLLFSGKSTRTDLPVAKESKKPAARKPRQSKKAETKPKTTVKSVFKATKATAAPSAKAPAKRALEAEQTTPIDPKSIYAADFNLRPSLKEESREGNSIDVKADDASTVTDSSLPPEPKTPTELDRPSSSHSLTISPPSKPRGFAAIID